MGRQPALKYLSQQYTMPIVDQNTQQYFSNLLNQYYVKQQTLYYFLFNVGVFSAFIIIVGGFLLMSYKNKPSMDEKVKQEIIRRDHIMSQIRFYREQRQKNELLTGLPILQ